FGSHNCESPLSCFRPGRNATHGLGPNRSCTHHDRRMRPPWAGNAATFGTCSHGSAVRRYDQPRLITRFEDHTKKTVAVLMMIARLSVQMKCLHTSAKSVSCPL